MPLSVFFGILTLATVLGAVVLVPRLQGTRYLWPGCVLVCAFFVAFILLADPRPLRWEVKLFRGLATGVTTVLLGLLDVWLKKRFPAL